MKKRVTVVVILCGVLFRFFHLGSHSFWCDEFLAISLARLKLSEMLAFIIRTDAHPPLFYTIVHFVFNFTQSEFGLRFLPALFGAGAIFVFCLLLKQWRDKDYLFPLALFAFSPAAILWSQMVKSYSMLTFFTLLSAYAFFRYAGSRRLVHAVLWVISALATLYLHNFGVIVLFAQVFTALLYRKEWKLRVFVLPFLIISLAYLPYLAGPVFSQVAFVQSVSRTSTNIFLRFANIFFCFVFGETLSPLNLKLVIPGGLVFLYLFVGGFFRPQNMLKVFSFCLLFSASVLTLFIPITIPQNLIHLQPFFFVLVAYGTDKIINKRKRIILSTMAVLFFIPSLYYYYRGESLQYHDASKLIPYRQVSRLIQDEGKPGEAIIFTEVRSRSFAGLIEPENPWDWYYKGNLPLIEINPINVKEPYKELEEIYEQYDGVWLLLNYGLTDRSWNDGIKDFFLDGKSVKIKELRLVKNYSFLDYLKGKGKKEYYFLEVYHLRKVQHDE